MSLELWPESLMVGDPMITVNMTTAEKTGGTTAEPTTDLGAWPTVETNDP